MRHLYLGAIAAVTFLTACTGTLPGEPNVSGTPSTVPVETAIGDRLDSLKITIIPDQSTREADNKKSTELKTYLSEFLGIPVEIMIARDYEDAVQQLIDGDANMAYLGPLTYIKAKELNPDVEPIVAPIDKNSGRPWYTSIIVSKKNIQSLAELRGKRFGFVNDSSTSGFLVPNYELKAQGINPKTDFAAVSYGGSHDKNLQLLLEGKVEAIAIDRATYRNALESGQLNPEKFHLLWESEPITNPPVVVSGTVDFQTRLDLQEALVKAPPGLVSISVNDAQGYTIVRDDDYDLIRKLYQAQENESQT